MSRDTSARIRGFVWFVYPDQAVPGALAGDNPFGVDVLEDETTAPGVVVFWAVDATATPIKNGSITSSRCDPSITDGTRDRVSRLIVLATR